MGIEPHEELEELLNGEAEPDLNGETPEEPEPKEPGEEKGVEAEAKGTEGEEPEEPEAKEGEPPSSEPKADQGVYEGMRAERAKRQLAEMELQEARAQLAALRQAEPRQQQSEPLDPYGEPESFTRSIQALVANTVSDAIRRDRLEASEAAMRERLGPDAFAELVLEFKQIAADDPSVMVAGNQSSDPAAYVEKVVNRHRKLKEIGDDPAAYEKRVEEKIRKELEAKFAGQIAEKQAQIAEQEKADALPKTIANSGGASPGRGEMPSDDLASLLGDTGL